MEEPQERGVEQLFVFPPHRRSHLRSGTYRSLVRLISLCCGDSPLANAPPIIPLHRTQDNGSNQGESGGNEIRESDESIVPDNREPANKPAEEGKVVDGGGEAAVLKDREPSRTQMVIDEIEQMMGIEENQDLLNQNDLMIGGSVEGPGFQDGEISLEQMLMNELENIMKGNEDCDNSNNCLATSLDQNQGNNCLGVSVNNQEESIDPPLVVEVSGMACQRQVDKEVAYQKIVEVFGYDSNEIDVSKSSEKVEDQSSLLTTNAVHEKIEIQQKEMELEKSVCSTDTMPSHGHVTEDGELEEGEIFGDIQLPNQSLDILSDDAVELEKMVGEELVSGGAFDDKDLYCNEENTANVKDSQFTSFNTNIGQITDIVTAAELEGSEGDQMVSELGRMHKKEGSGKILKQSESENQVTKSKMKEDVGVCRKKKKGPISEEKKEKKKLKKRKKRAEKNRKLGVKRLKLQTVLKPKAVTYCNHYLKGRCYEGEKCKFSHDTVPLTKSQPCCHFARHSCMKGDDCPFDHQLSKYPCNNYMSKGFCGRGDDCLFSHKLSPAGDDASLSNAHELLLKPTLQGDSDMRLNISRNVDASSCSALAFFQKSKKPIVAETPNKTPDLAFKGVKSPFVSSVAESSKLNQGSSSQKMIESGRVGIQSNQSMSGVYSPFASKPSLADAGQFSEGSSSLKMNKSVRLGTQANQSKLATNQIVDDSPKRKTEVVPSGINFLSFGKSLEDSTSKVSLALKRGDGCKQHPIGNEGERGKLSNQTTQISSSTDQKKTHPAVVPLGINFLSLGKLGNLRSNEASIPSASDAVNNGSVLDSNYASDKQQNLSAISYKLPVCPETSGQSSECLSDKGTPNAAQKALVSTVGVARQLDNVKGRYIHESQHVPDKQDNSNPIPSKRPAYMLTISQSSEKMSQKSTPNSAQRALMSTLSFAAKFESGMKKNQSAMSTGVNNETRDSRNW